MAARPAAPIMSGVSRRDFGHQEDGRRGKRRAWQARLFPQLSEPLSDALARPIPQSPPPRSGGGQNNGGLGRQKSPPERADLTVTPPRLTPLVRDWLGDIESSETRRAYRRDATFLMRRLALDTDPKLAALGRGDAVRYRDALQVLVDAGDASAGLARRRMAAALSLFDHLHRRYLVGINPFAKLRRPREGGIDGPPIPRARRPCRRLGCPLVVLGAAARAGAVTGLPPRRPPRRSTADGPHQLRLW